MQNTLTFLCVYISSVTHRWMPALKIIHLASAAPVWVSSNQQLYDTSKCAAVIPLAVGRWFGLAAAVQRDLSEAGALIFSPLFPSILLCQLKEREDRPGCPRELPLTSQSISATLEGGLHGSRSQWRRLGLLKWALSGATQCLSRRMCCSLEMQSRKQLHGQNETERDGSCAKPVHKKTAQMTKWIWPNIN